MTGKVFAALAWGLTVACGGASTAEAQISSNTPPPKVSFVDEIGYDLKGGGMLKSSGTLSIGHVDDPALAYTFFEFSSSADKGVPRDGAIYFFCDDAIGTCETTVKMGHRFDSDLNLNSDLTWDLSPSGFTVTERNGTAWVFLFSLKRPYKTLSGPGSPEEGGRLSKIIYPNGTELSYVYASDSDGPSASDYARSITSNTGYQIHFDFSPGKVGPVKARLINLAVDYCSPTEVTCSASSEPWPQVSFSTGSSPYSATDTLGRSSTTTGWYFPSSTVRKLEYTSPGGAGLTIRSDKYIGVGYPCSLGCWKLSQIQMPFGTWSYDFLSGTITSANPLGGVTKFKNTSSNPSLLSATLTDGLNRATQAILGETETGYGSGQPADGELGGIIYPAGNRVDWSFDARHNRTSATVRPPAGSGEAPLVSTMHYPATCTVSTRKTCNQPSYTIDARGMRTDYTYAPEHGGILTKTMPADTNGVRPQIRYTYQQLSALYKNAAGQLVAGLPIWKLVRTSSCLTQASCAGTAGEAITEIGYDGNLLPNSETVRSGDNSVSATTLRGYDAIGNLIWVDGPLAGADDRTYYFWDAGRQPIGEISPDPDGTGPLPRLATKRTFNLDGLVTSEKTGTTTGTTLAALNAMTVNQEMETTYDAGGRKVGEAVKSGSTIHALTQFSYDLANRLECTAQRMNPAIYSSLPASACTLGAQGADANDFGPDRIVKNVYDAAGQVTKIQKAFGTTLQEDSQTYTYSLNGMPTSLTDARGYKATMTYDGFDRQTRWYFPSPTTTGVTSTTDYEEYGYDANGNRISLRKRDGSTITYQYDALNRNTVKIVPERTALNATYTRDIYYGYDLRGLQTYARFDSASGEGLTFTYDGFGRPIDSTAAMDGASRTFSYWHDKNGNRTQLSWPDLAKTSYSYDGLDRMSVLHEGALGSTVNLVSYGYNSRGLRAAQSGLYGQVTTFGYDVAGRLNGLGHDFAGSANDVAFTYGYTPASQIAQQSRDNDAYAWTAHFNVDRSYATNGLNQYTAAGAATFTYDANGNLIGDGTKRYIYDVENRLVWTGWADGSTIATLRYDPLGRLYEIGGPGLGVTRFLHDGDELVAEYDGVGTLQRRYVHGKNVDDPVVWYEGSGQANPHWLHTDHQGSVIAVTTPSGAVAINSYDEYGIPAPGNLGRFQYTGQAWLPELGMYYYKARIYSPTLGRFLQTDPIGYDDQVNLYAYVANDPVNGTDPTGNACEKPDSSSCPNDDDHTFRDRMAAAGAAAGAIVGGVAGGTAGGTGGAVAGAACGPGAVACSPAGAAAGATAGAAAGAAGGAVAGGVVGGLIGAAIDKGIVLFNKATGDASTPTGSRGSPIDVKPGTNAPTRIGGREYSGHSLDRMQGRGVTPSVVENAIQNGARSAGNAPGTFVHAGDRVIVITNSAGRVITVITK